MNVVAQLMGLLALIFLVLSMQQSNKKALLKIQILVNIFYGIQYLLLNALSAASMSIVSLLRCLLFYDNAKNKRHTSIVLLIGFMIVIIIFSIFTYDGYHSLIPIAIAILYTYALWQENMTVFRIISAAVAIMWIYYNGVVGAYVAIVGSVIELTSAIVAIVRFDKKKFSIDKASMNDIDLLITFKFNTIMESDEDNRIDDKEKDRILNYIIKSTKEHIDDYSLILVHDNVAGAFLIYNYEDGVLLDEIYLIDRYREKGIGSTIIANIVKKYNKIYLWVYKNNSKAISLYKRFHFDIIEETETRYKMLYMRRI